MASDQIYEKIAPGEVYILSRQGDYLNVIENHDGIAVFRKVCMLNAPEEGLETTT